MSFECLKTFLTCSSLLPIVFLSGNKDEIVASPLPPEILEDNEVFLSIGDLWPDDKEETLWFFVIDRPFSTLDVGSEDFRRISSFCGGGHKNSRLRGNLKDNGVSVSEEANIF